MSGYRIKSLCRPVLRDIITVRKEPIYVSQRLLHCSSITFSGHSRWSKIKHDKGTNDAAKNKQRSIFSQEIATASKCNVRSNNQSIRANHATVFGPDPNANPRLADLITKAKRAGFAKTSIESAIARGQGRSVSGASLEAVTVEGILPGNVGVVIDCETDNKARTISDVRLAIKDQGGSSTPASFLFAKKGRIIFEHKDGVGIDEVFEPALETGALDVTEDADGRVVIYTEPSDTKSASAKLSAALDLEIVGSEIIWDANEDTRVPLVDDKAAIDLAGFVEKLQEKESNVQGVYMNVAQGKVEENYWAELQSRLTA